MGVDRCVLFRVFRQRDLLVGVCQVQLREELPARERCKDVLDAREWVWVSLGDSIDGQFIVATDSNAASRRALRKKAKNPTCSTWDDFTCPIPRVVHLYVGRFYVNNSTYSTWDDFTYAQMT